MNIQICSRRIIVLVTDEVRDSMGDLCQGVFDPEHLTILLDRAMPRDDRRGVLVHELTHAFDYIVGRVAPNDPESQAQRVAAIEGTLADALEQLSPYAGDRAIHELFGDADDTDGDAFPGDLDVVQESEVIEWSTDVSCPHCHTAYSGRRVRNGKPAFDPQRDTFAVWRILSCTECDRVIRWRQMSTYDGIPLPKIIVPPTSRQMSLA
jgi:hypothetical protein